MEWRQFLRFGLVGILNTCFSFSIYGLLVWWGVHFALANLLATVVGVVLSFRTHGRWVFHDCDWRALRRYVPVWALCYGLNIGIIAVLMRLGLDAYGAGALAVPPTVLAAYLLQRRFVFVGRSSSNTTGVKT
ncbi:MAG: hypothetical protein RLZZ451_250 [Pseudomonadota bacterium]